MPQADPLIAARLLLEQGRTREAHAALAPMIAAGHEGASARSLMGLVLYQMGDLSGSAHELRRAVQLAPEDGAAEFALASLSNRLGNREEAEAAARRAIAKGLDEASVHALLGRILSQQGRLEEAECAWRLAVRHDPAMPQAQRELAELVWMRTGDVVQARALLDAAPKSQEITAITLRLMETAGEAQAAYDLATASAVRDPELHLLAARAALGLDPEAAERHLKLAPTGVMPAARAKTEIEVDLALGRATRAARRAEALHSARPADQAVTALMATAWRLSGDPRYRALYDYDALVGCYPIAPPDGWSDLGVYLGDLGRALDQLHGPRAHPVGQSLRCGSQTIRSLGDYPDPAIRALFGAIDAPIRRHIAEIGAPGQDYSIAGAWSVRLNSGGFHVNHVHPEGWLSSAFYVRTPQILPGTEGFLKFGEPGPPTRPQMASEHLVRPEPGLLVLFPSYMWHGTEPFAAQETRLSCAFDIVRAQR
jgi:tetratricopeptide (TPR) repeat protein